MLNVGTVILAQRKAAGLTQQAVADFLGVSKASVSKWETGQSYPDITLLPLLASFFNITVDELLAYSAQLSDAEVAQLYRQLQARLLKEPARAVYQAIEVTIHRYYACPNLVLSMGLLLLNHSDLLPGNRLTYIQEAQALFAHVPTITQTPTLLDKATKLAAMCDLMLQQPQAVLAKLGTTAPEVMPADSLIAGAYQQLGQMDQASATLQSGLYQNVAVMLSGLTNYLQLTIAAPERFTATVQRGQALIEAFKVARLNPIVAINFWSSAAVGFGALNQADQVAQQLHLLLPVLQSLPEPLTLHGDAYFDQIDDWLAATETAGVTPRNSGHVKAEMAQLLLTHPALQELFAQPALSPLQAQLKELTHD